MIASLPVFYCTTASENTVQKEFFYIQSKNVLICTPKWEKIQDIKTNKQKKTCNLSWFFVDKQPLSRFSGPNQIRPKKFW